MADQNVRNKTTEDLRQRAASDYSRLPNRNERRQLETRLRRLDRMQTSVRTATANLARLANQYPRDGIRIRDEFVANSDPAPGDPSDRRIPARQHRPPSTRLVTPRGSALRLILIALFEAQMQSPRPGSVPRNQLPLEGHGGVVGWTDLMATDATAAGSGDTYVSIRDKKRKHLGAALNTLEEQELVALPHGAEARNQHREFQLLMEWGRLGIGENERYHVPRAKEKAFTVPITLFTNGWIHVLEDRELAYLLMLCFLHAVNPDGMRVRSDFRLLHMGIGRETMAVHGLFEPLDLVEVTSDPGRRDDGTVEEFAKEGAIPDLLRFLPQGLDADGYQMMMREIDYQLSR